VAYNQAMFFSFDGVDGVGKSTQIRLFCDWLRIEGKTAVTCRDPGGTPLGEKLRELLLDHHDVPIHRRAEMLLYMASRAQLVEEVIRPALSAGHVVVSDRYLLANVVYQAHAADQSGAVLNPDDVWRVGTVTVGGVMPDLVLLFDMPAEKAAARIGRSPDRMESRGVAYLEQVRQGFLTEAGRFPHQIAVINADQPVDAVHAEVIAAAKRVLTPGS
jgi:dTMP kinase